MSSINFINIFGKAANDSEVQQRIRRKMPKGKIPERKTSKEKCDLPIIIDKTIPENIINACVKSVHITAFISP
jgi:hypothetical protein